MTSLNTPTTQRFLTAIWILSVLDNTLNDAIYAARVVGALKHSELEPYYEVMNEAKNLHTAAVEAMKAAAASLLSEHSVNTFYMLAELSLTKAMGAQMFAVQVIGNTHNVVRYRNRFSAAVDTLISTNKSASKLKPTS